MPSGKGRTMNIVCLLIFLYAPHHHHRLGPYTLPAEAKITIGKPHTDPNDAQDAMICPSFHLNEYEVREMFRTYHLLKPGELHDNYSFPSCRIEGNIVVKNQRFYWIARPGNTLDTDWPDGKPKMLGGVPSENPADY